MISELMYTMKLYTKLDYILHMDAGGAHLIKPVNFIFYCAHNYDKLTLSIIHNVIK